MAVIEQQADKEQEIFFNFITTLKSPITKESYQVHIRRYLSFCNLTKLCELLTIQEPQKQIIKYISFLKEKKLSTNSIHTMLYGIYHFYMMADTILNKQKINSYIGEPTLKQKDRPYNNDEIIKALNVSDLRMKVVIGIMSSAGLRIGAITELKLRNVERIESCYKIVAYEGSKEEYYSFCTPECTSFIDAYLEYRTKSGEILTPQSYLIRDQFDVTDLDQIRNKSRGITTGTLKVMLNLTLVKAGIRAIDHTTTSKRKEVAMSHGFRKRYTTQMVKSKIQPEIRWLLEGHKLKGNDESYVKISEDVGSMYSEYQKAIDNLTINEENRLRKKVQILEVEKSRLDRIEDKMKSLEAKYRK